MVVEVTAVFLGGTLAARLLLRTLGITGSKQAIQSATSTSFDAAAVAIPMSIRWAVVIGLAFLVGYLVARHRPRDYGFTSGGNPWRVHLRTALMVYALGYAPALILMLLRHYVPLSGGPAVWKAFDEATWNLDFWLFILASSIVIPVVVEETFFRGYAQTRFSTVFRPLTAIAVISVVFMLAHTQYADGTFLGTGMLVTGAWWAILLGLARLRTGSLIAPMLAHALSNTPLRPPVQLLLLALLVTTVLVMRRHIASFLSPPRES